MTRDEPTWLRERRESARRAFESLPPPYPDRTDLTRVDYASYAHPAEARPVLAGEPPKDVVFCPLDEAARDRAELVRPNLFAQVRPEAGKFEALHASAWSGGAFVYVPAGVDVPEPLEIVWPAPPAGSTYAPHTLVLLDKGASATVLQSTADGDEGRGPALVSSAVEVVLGDGARLRFADVQNWGAEVTNLSARCGRLHRDSGLEWVLGEVGSRLTCGWTTSLLEGPGSEARSYLVFFASGGQHMDLSLSLVHHGAHTNGDMVARGALKDAARAIYRGTSDIKRGAKHSNSQQRENTLHLTDGVRSDAIPSLYIDEHELAAGHAATVGKVDEEQVFYLRSRGLPEREALRLIVHGFFAPLFERIPIERVREALGRLIDRKMEG
jgi:Fe-S cluster assembly protein SufD